MRQLAQMSALLLLLGLCSCGDPRQDFVGSFDVQGRLSLSDGNYQETALVDVPMVVVADAFDSDKLYLDFDCGLVGTIEDHTSFSLDRKKCPSDFVDGCELTWTFREGEGTKTEGDPTLALRFSGDIKVSCSGDSPRMYSFTFTLTATQDESVSKSSRQEERTQSIRTALEQAALSSFRRGASSTR
ncbi:hypothetical protein JQX13_24415 [Archangium violaceum]|uniref:hypothetical protein n=1 Tax=Archangium violaceum TaxID=83451 RepID=UPI00193B5304|nr:hypothetical protein [Archangium violaceum]QRK12899.1 hypothetical protein JQX13_24415 [Archangium violaceum]